MYIYIYIYIEHYSFLVLWQLFRLKKADVPHQINIACSFCRKSTD